VIINVKQNLMAKKLLFSDVKSPNFLDLYLGPA